MLTSLSASSTISGVVGAQTAGALGDAVAPPFYVAYAVNVKQHVPIALSLERPNFSKWKAFFTALCAKYGLLGHIDGMEDARPADPTWSQPDACIRGWMYGSIDDQVLDLAMEPDLFVSVEALFQANKESRAVVLGQEFHSMSQGDLSIDAYAQRMKHTADALREVGHTISPGQLVLNLLRGLNARFANTADIIANTMPLPDFKAATNMLRVKELRLGLGNEGKETTASALAASTVSSCTSPSCRSTSSPTSNRGGNGKGKGGKGKGRSGNGRNQQQQQGAQQQHGAPQGFSGGRQAPQPVGPWVCYSPWAAWWPPQQQPPQWRAPSAPTPPLPPPHQAHTAFAPPQFSAPPAYGSWDQAGLIAALNQMAIHGSNP